MSDTVVKMHHQYQVHVMTLQDDVVRVDVRPDVEALQEQDAWSKPPHEVVIAVDGDEKATLTVDEADKLRDLLTVVLRRLGRDS